MSIILCTYICSNVIYIECVMTSTQESVAFSNIVYSVTCFG